jgi:phage FluMu gp28-like protein
MTEQNLKNDFDQARGATGVLLPYQARWVADQVPVKFIEKSRVSASPGRRRQTIPSTPPKRDRREAQRLVHRLPKDMALEFIWDCANWARAYNLAASAMEEYEEPDEEEVGGVVVEKKILAYRITLESGWRITALSSRPTNLRGKQGRVVIDEAAFHDDLPGLLKAAMALLMWGGQVRVISTHFGDTNEFNSVIQDIRAKKKPYSLHRVDFDDALKDGLYKRICEVLGREWTQEAEAAWAPGDHRFYGEDATRSFSASRARARGPS